MSKKCNSKSSSKEYPHRQPPRPRASLSGLPLLSHRGSVSEFSLLSHTPSIHCFQEQKKCVWLHITLIMESGYGCCLTASEWKFLSSPGFCKMSLRNADMLRINEHSEALFFSLSLSLFLL